MRKETRKEAVGKKEKVGQQSAQHAEKKRKRLHSQVVQLCSY